MKLLRDEDIFQLQRSAGFLTGLDVSDQRKAAELDDSPIQPCSVDLRIGAIYVPGKAKNGSPKKFEQYDLPPGHTAVVVTDESFKMPSNLAGFGFPMAHISSKGLLMTNPGHIDPGYVGTIQCTLINMGKETYPLHVGHPIVTILLFELESPVKFDYSSRNRRPNGTTPNSSTSFENTLERLSMDFLEVSRRARCIAKAELGKSVVWLTGCGLIFGAIITWIGAAQRNEWKAEVVDVRKSLEKAEAVIEARRLRTEETLANDLRALHSEQDLSGLRQRIELLEAKGTAGNSTPSPSQPGTPSK